MLQIVFYRYADIQYPEPASTGIVDQGYLAAGTQPR
jgi:hypothetical protein